MIGLNKGIQKLIASGIALMLTLTAMFVAAFAILSTSKMGLTVNVSYDPAVTAKVYLATNSTTAGQFYQSDPTINVDELTDFDTSKSALVLNTYDTTALTRASFEALGSGTNNGLKCDASGEIEFYVYVENYSETENVYYRANITFTNSHGTDPFSVIENPSFETAETAGGG